MKASSLEAMATCISFGEGTPVAIASDSVLNVSGERSQQEIVDLLLDDMRQHWMAGRRPVAEQYLAILPADIEPQLAVDLIYGEFLLRQEQDESPSGNSYLARFPHYRTQLERQFDFDAVLFPTSDCGSQSTVASTSGARHPLLTGKSFPQPLGKYVL